MPPRALALLCFFCSGATGLLYQVLWTRQLGNTIGNTHFSITVVVAVFMGGLALGSWIGGRAADRTPSPLRLYGILVIAAGVLCLVVPAAVWAAQPLFRWLYSFHEGEPEAPPLLAARIAFSAVLLLAPTTCMGATLPVLSRYFTTRLSDVGFSVGRLYTINTFGAFAGVSLTGFFLIPSVGVAGTMLLSAGADLAIGLAVLAAAGREPAPASAPAAMAPNPAVAEPALPGFRHNSWDVRLVVLAFFATGFANMLLEIAWTKAMVQTIGNSTYAFSLVVALFICGIGAGGLVMTCFVDRLRNLSLALGIVVTLTAVLNAATIPILGLYPLIGARLFDGVEEPSYGKFLTIQLLLVSAIILPSTVLMGMVFPLVGKIRTLALERVGRSIGSAYFANTLGAILGTLASGFVFIPLFARIYHTLYLGAAINLAVGALLVAAALRLARPGFAAVALRAAVVLAILAAASAPHALLRPHGELGEDGYLWHPSIHSRGAYAYFSGTRYSEKLGGEVDHVFQELGELAARVIEGNRVEWYKEGIHAPVAVVRSPGGALAMRISGKVEASLPAKGGDNQDLPHQILAGHLPMLLHPAPSSVLTLGLGGGVTLGTLTLYGAAGIDSLEISPEVIEAARLYFDRANRGALGEHPLSPVRNVVGDGRNHLRYTDRQYDVVTSVPSNPWIAGIGNLFTVEFFAIVKERLTPGGVFSNWIHKVNMRAEDLRTVVRTFIAVFDEHAQLWDLGFDCLLVGSTAPIRLDAARVARLLAEEPGIREDLASLGITGSATLLRHCRLDLAAMRGFAGDGPRNTDNFPVLEFSCPKGLYGHRLDAYRALAAAKPTSLGGDWLAGMPEGTLEEARTLQAAFASYQLAEGLTDWLEDRVAGLGAQEAVSARRRLRFEAEHIVELLESTLDQLERVPDAWLDARSTVLANTALGVEGTSLAGALRAYYETIAEAMEKAGSSRDALAYREKLWKRSRGDPRAARLLAIACLRAGELARGIEVLSPHAAAKDAEAVTLQVLATLHGASNDLDRAVNLLGAALERVGANAPLASEIHQNLAFALLKRADLAGARRHYEEALRLDPTNAGAKSALESLTRPGAGGR